MRIKHIINICLVLLVSLGVMAGPALAIDVSPGDRIELSATSRLGVPLHETSAPSLVGRAADGTIAEVIETANSGQWVKLKLPDGSERWVVERYIDAVVAENPAGEMPVIDSPVVMDEPVTGSPPVSSPNRTSPRTSFPGLLFPDLSGEALRAQLAQSFAVKNSLGYRSARDYMFSTLDNDNGIVRGIYSGFEQPVNPNSSNPRQEAFQNQTGLNAEHSWPQSKGATGTARSDLHHLFPAQVRVNSRRGSSPFAEIDDNQTRWWLIDDDQFSDIPTTNIDAYSEATRSAFEPREAVKGDIARAQFYVYTLYREQADDSFFDRQQDVLCDWNQADPVDTTEQRRNQAIATQQGNENPFVLDPTLANRLYCTG